MTLSKICSSNRLAETALRLPRPLVFTNGVFDLLHRGHVQCLQAARELGASLVVGINSDASARALGKGPGRPLNTEADRAAVLAALESVDLVTVFEEPTPLSMLASLRPDIYAKGGDYHGRLLPEIGLVRQWGGRTVILDYTPGLSTTAIIARAVLANHTSQPPSMETLT